VQVRARQPVTEREISPEYFGRIQLIAPTSIVTLSLWLTAYGLAAISIIFLLYLLVSQFTKKLDAPLTIYLYTICSLELSGIAGDLLKEVIARPRPAAVYSSEILVLSQSATPSMLSGHATKSIALILPFILLVPSSNGIHKGIKVLIALLAAGVCFSRIVLGAHYVSDVVAGIGMGVLGLPFSMLFAQMILKQTQAELLPFLSKVWGVLLFFLTFVFMQM
jgi:membrane-associated phospholipid phosphatase